MILEMFPNDKNHRRVRNHCHFTGKYRDTAHSICNLKFNVLNEIPVVFHNGSNYDNQFTIKELANECEEQFECLGENTEKLKTFSIPIEKGVMKIDKDGNEFAIAISCNIKLFDSARFMASSLLNLVDIILQKELITLNVKIGCFFEYDSVNDSLIKYKFLSCNKYFSNKFDEKLRK